MILITVGLIALLTWLGPEEKSLGANVRLVYLHGAWVLTALLGFATAGVCGIVGLVRRKPIWHVGSQVIGRTAILFWISYLPLSLWAMQTNWNGLFLAEPRMRLALIFAVSGALLQVGLWLINRPAWTSLGNAVYVVCLVALLTQTDSVMHPPPSPIFNSGNILLIGYFVALNLLTIILAGEIVFIQSKRFSDSPSR
jgi:hypothetical protein